MLFTAPAGIPKVIGSDGKAYEVANGVLDLPEALGKELAADGFAPVQAALPEQITRVIDLALLRGEKGDPGASIKGDPGEVGPIPKHRWGDTSVQFELPGNRWGEPVELKGDVGPPGERGPIGPMPRHRWDATSLQFERAPGVWGELVDLQGPKGKPGETRVVPGGGGMPSSTPASGATITGSAGQIPVCDGAGNAAGSADFTSNGGNVDVGALFVAHIDALSQYDVTQFKLAAAFILDFGAVPFIAPTGDFTNAADIGFVGGEWRTGYFGTSVVSPLFSVASGAGNSGITTTITTGSLVGKTITIQGGIITGFA